MRFSIIMPCYLGPYEGAASNREEKLMRAVDSVLVQTFQDWELIVVADGCPRTFDLLEERYSKDPRIDYCELKKQPLWSGKVREHGIARAKGDYILYLDSDDKLGPNHLEKIDQHLQGRDWVWFNDLLCDKKGIPHERQIYINRKFHNGTSNICHRRDLIVRWGEGYGKDDWSAVQSLLRYPNHAKIPTPEYIVCHLPKRLDV